MSQRVAVGLGLGLACFSPARAAPQVAEPTRLTAGASDELLGELSPDGRTLTYVSNQNATTQIFVRDLDGGPARLLFDEAADVTWPRVSPDGARLLYVSTRENAAGALCVRHLPPPRPGEAPREPGHRRCLTPAGAADVQAVWLPDGRRALVLGRPALHDDFRLDLVDTDRGTRAPVLARNLSSPALSPDGRWLAYVPVARRSSAVGPNFAMRAQGRIELVRLEDGRPAGAPVALAVDLPGTSGFPSFSRDGRWLYFSQYLNDTTLDGAIDADDASVLYRVPFRPEAAAPAQGDRPEQLTRADWDCHYAAPARDRLVATCALGGSLDVYALPLPGAIPPAWAGDRTRLAEALEAQRPRWERLLLLARLETLAPPTERPRVLLEMLRIHLQLDEHESARHDARRLGELGGAPDAARLSRVLLELVEHRRAEAALARGQLTEPFVKEARARLGRVASLAEGAGPDARAVARVATSELLDVLGEKPAAAAALALWTPASLDGITLAFPAQLLAERAQALYRALDDPAPLLSLLSRLAGHPALTPRERLEQASLYVDELTRGRAAAARIAALDRALAQAAPGGTAPDPGELGFALEIARHLADLDRGASEEDVRRPLFELYRRHKAIERRRYLVRRIVAAAAPRDRAFLLYQFAESWVSGVPVEGGERAQAEALYRDVVLERAYVARAGGQVGDARGLFYGITLQTDSLEAHAAFIEAALAERRDPLADYRRRYAQAEDAPVFCFARAYLAARGLAAESDPQRREADSTLALGQLRKAERALGGQAELHHLWGHVLHLRFLRAGDKRAAQEAHTRYLLALDLARERPRARAVVLDALGALQAQVGNHQLALGHLEARAALPFAEPVLELEHRLLLARTRFKLDRDEEAAATADEALALIERTPALVPYRVLALDRAALYHLAAAASAPAGAAGHAARARALYDALEPLTVGLPRDEEGARARFTSRLGRGAAALAAGDPRAAAAELGAARTLLADPSAPRWPEPAGWSLRRAGEIDPRLGARRVAELQLLLDGLEAEAHRADGDLDGAHRLLASRRDALAQRLAQRDLDEDVLELAATELRLGEVAYRARKLDEARAHLEAGLAHADAFGRRTETPIHPTGLRLLESFAELAVYGGARAPGLAHRLEETYALLCARPNPAWRPARERLGLYLALVRLGARPAASP